MNKQTQSKIDEIGTVAGDKSEIITNPADLANETMGAARARLKSAVERGEELIANLRETTGDRAKSADRAIREHPYQALAVAAGLGALVAFLLTRGRKKTLSNTKDFFRTPAERY